VRLALQVSRDEPVGGVCDVTVTWCGDVWRLSLRVQSSVKRRCRLSHYIRRHSSHVSTTLSRHSVQWQSVKRLSSADTGQRTTVDFYCYFMCRLTAGPHRATGCQFKGRIGKVELHTTTAAFPAPLIKFQRLSCRL